MLEDIKSFLSNVAIIEGYPNTDAGIQQYLLSLKPFSKDFEEVEGENNLLEYRFVKVGNKIISFEFYRDTSLRPEEHDYSKLDLDSVMVIEQTDNNVISRIPVVVDGLNQKINLAKADLFDWMGRQVPHTVNILLWDDNTDSVEARHGDKDFLYTSTIYNKELIRRKTNIRFQGGVMTDENGNKYYPLMDNEDKVIQLLVDGNNVTSVFENGEDRYVVSGETIIESLEELVKSMKVKEKLLANG